MSLLSLSVRSFLSCLRTFSSVQFHTGQFSTSSLILTSTHPSGLHQSSAASVRSLSTSLTSAMSHPSKPSLQDLALSSSVEQQNEGTVRPYSDIPKAKTVLGLNWGMMRNPQNTIPYLKGEVKRLGSTFRITGLPSLPEMVLVANPSDVEKVFRETDANYPKRFSLDDWKRVKLQCNMPFGMLLDDGEKWHSQRMPISKFVMMPRKMAEYHMIFNEVAKDYVSLIRKQREKGNSLFLDVTTSLNKWSFESVSYFVLGKRLECLAEKMPPDFGEFINCMHSFTEISNELLFSLPLHKLVQTKRWKKLVRSFGTLYHFTGGLVEEKVEEVRKENKTDRTAELGMDFLTYMICSGKMNLKEITVNAIDMMNAGIDTTSLTMSGCLYALGTHPEVQEKLRQEVQSVVGTDEVVTSQHIQEMHYLRDCIKETQRTYPILTINSRITTEDIEVAGYHIPAGKTILLPILLSGRLPELFPEPDEFKPERWSRENAELPHPFASLPFGYGRRGCVGRRVAELEMHILLAHLMKNFKIEYREDKPMEFITKLFYEPERQLNLTFADLS